MLLMDVSMPDGMGGRARIAARQALGNPKAALGAHRIGFPPSINPNVG
ncbi:hypothetical protein [Mesorhizobium sp.]|nr:hypothetical protein [Mesorhizobium sp.]